jgi:predicted DNA-binding protein (MmcQ/YjbR family)
MAVRKPAMKKSAKKSKDPQQELVAYAMSLPGATEHFPWGERVAKVGGKVFVFFGRSEEGDIGIGVKLPESGPAALSLPFCEPTGYGLGKSGWVTVQFTDRKKMPLPLLRQWIDESYRAVAPKKFLKQLSEV